MRNVLVDSARARGAAKRGGGAILKFPLPHQHIGGVVRERFVSEARSGAALDHPNLCTVQPLAMQWAAFIGW